jgi:predicted glycosyltransferase
LYSPNENSLGRLRRTLAIAGELARRRPDAAILGLVGHPQIEAYGLPPGFDYVKLPALGKWRLYDDLPPDPTADSALQGVRHLREGLIRRFVSDFAARLLVVETPPGGAGGELVRTLRDVRAAWPRPTLTLILRDVENDAPSVRKNWEQEGYYELLDHVYDHILVVGSREVFDPIREYGLSPAAAAKTTFCGYIRRPEPLTPPEPIREQLGVGTSPLVVVSVGGGRDGITVLRAYLAALADGLLDGVISLVVTGPLLPEADQAELASTAERLRGVKLMRFTPDFLSYLNAADLAVTAGGHNTTCEAVSLGKRTIVVPREGSPRERVIRAERFAQRGLVSLLHPEGLTSERLAAAARATLGASPPTASLDFDGLRRLGDLLAACLEISPA